MKKVVRFGGSLVVVLLLLLVTLRATGFEPRACPNAGASWTCQTPGLWLRGDPITTPVTDWSFTDAVPTIKVQTQSPWLLPYSVAAWCATYNGNLYVTSYRGRRWTEDIISNPRVRLKIGDRLFERDMMMVTDPAEKAAVIQAKAKKYPSWKPPTVEAATVFRVTQ
jgi:hypothetical protein